jgi:TetR/AcrR family transcriptional repressor of mexJK operon
VAACKIDNENDNSGEGNVRLSNRRDAFLDAGRALFLAKGYEATSLSDVVKAAGGSLTTLYKLFGNKEGLLTAIVRQRTGSEHNIIADVAALELPPAETLREIGYRLNQHFLDPTTIRMWRIVIAHSINEPDFGRHFFDEMLSDVFGSLTAVFERIRAQGVRLRGEPASLTRIYLSIMVHEFQVEAIATTSPSQCAGKDIAERVEFFLVGAGIKD